MRKLFIGFSVKKEVYGCTYDADSVKKLEDVKGNINEMFQSKPISYFEDVFYSIEWKHVPEDERTPNGIYLLRLLEKGINGYAEYMTKTLKYLLQDGNFTTAEKKEIIEDEMEEYINIKEGKTLVRLNDSAEDFKQEKVGEAVIIDLDEKQLRHFTCTPQ